MIRSISLGLLAALSASAALAAGQYDYLIGPRIESRNPATGQTSTTRLTADGLYSLSTKGADGAPVQMTGKWEVRGDKLCFEIDAAAHKFSCAVWGAHAVGDSFSISTDTGDTYEIHLTAS